MKGFGPCHPEGPGIKINTYRTVEIEDQTAYQKYKRKNQLLAQTGAIAMLNCWYGKVCTQDVVKQLRDR